MKKTVTLLFLVVLLVLGACSNSGTTSNQNESATSSNANSENKSGDATSSGNIIGTLNLDKSKGRIGDQVTLTAEKLLPNTPLTVVWSDMIGSYALENNYSFIGTTYEPDDKELLTGTADGDGKWTGTITIPDGFGDDHDIMIVQNGQTVAQANFFVETVFTMSPESGPIGTEITITGEGLSWKMYGSLWHLNYDNKYSGMITAVSTKGKAKAVIRAAGGVGPHTITIESGASGRPFINRDESAVNYIKTQYFTFNVTDATPQTELFYVEEAPKAANEIIMPAPVNKDGVTISIDKAEGIVGEPVTITGSGLPANETIELDWYTMVGTRVTTQGFAEKVFPLGEAKTDNSGNFRFDFTVPDDLGGLPHLIDVRVKDEVVGQTYLRILPSIISVEPSSGPANTPFVITIKGSGWTEFDNALAVTYDNATLGYVCAFNNQGTLEIPLIASGEVGYHLIDIIPTIYKGQQIQPNLYLNPMLTYRQDHPGTGIPAVRTFFEVTEGDN